MARNCKIHIEAEKQDSITSESQLQSYLSKALGGPIFSQSYPTEICNWVQAILSVFYRLHLTMSVRVCVFFFL
jgi:hypothetical protein